MDTETPPDLSKIQVELENLAWEIPLTQHPVKPVDAEVQKKFDQLSDQYGAAIYERMKSIGSKHKWTLHESHLRAHLGMRFD